MQYNKVCFCSWIALCNLDLNKSTKNCLKLNLKNGPPHISSFHLKMIFCQYVNLPRTYGHCL